MAFLRKPGKRFFLAAVMASVLLSGCKSKLSIVTEITEAKAYTMPQSMIILTTERNRYQQVYTGQVWGVKLPGNQSFETYLVDQVQEFLEEMKMLNLLAESKGVILSGSEKDLINKASEEYFDSLTKEDISYMGIREEDVRAMYGAYRTAGKVVEELTKDMNLEISDSEAKVIIVDQIVLSDAAAAAEALAKAEAEGADFSEVAREYSEDPVIERSIGRGEEPGAYEEAAFSLSSGEISQAVEEKGKYYILKCISDYDETATQERKEGLYQERKREAFDKIYSRFKEENPIAFNREMWKNVKFSKEDKTTTTGFFDVYKKYFSN